MIFHPVEEYNYITNDGKFKTVKTKYLLRLIIIILK